MLALCVLLILFVKLPNKVFQGQTSKGSKSPSPIPRARLCIGDHL